MRTRLSTWFSFTLIAVMLAGGTALAQDEPLLGDPPPTEAQPPPPPPPPPPPTPAPAAPAAAAPAAPAAGAMTPRKLKDVTDTDHDMVVKALGLQVTYIANLGPGFPLVEDPEQRKVDASFSMLGIRYWVTRRVGLDLGLGLVVAKPLGDDTDAAAGFGIVGGVPFALGVYRHVTMFAGPEVAFALYHPGPDANPWMFMLRGKTGIELHLGFIDIPRVSITGSFSLGLRIYNDNNSTEIVLAPDYGTTLRGLFESSVGLVFYL